MLNKNKDLYNKILNEFRNEIGSNKVYLIGIDFIGMMISAKLGLSSQNSFSYIPSKKNINYYGYYDREVKFEKESKIVLVTDVIVTGETLKYIIDILKFMHNIEDVNIFKVFTIFTRQPINSCVKNYLHCVEGKIVSLNNYFDIEFCNKTKCIFRENGILKCENTVL